MIPKGKVEVIKFIPRESTSLVRATMVCRDEDGVLWQFPAAWMPHELEPYSDIQTLRISAWKDLVHKILGWRLSKRLTRDLAEQLYREGLSVEAAVHRIQHSDKET